MNGWWINEWMQEYHNIKNQLMENPPIDGKSRVDAEMNKWITELRILN